MKPFAAATLTELQWAIADPGRNYLVYSAQGQPVRLDLRATNGRFNAYWINPKTGDLQRQTALIQAGREVAVHPPGSAPAVLWLSVLDN
jgi:hypothetical protein